MRTKIYKKTQQQQQQTNIMDLWNIRQIVAYATFTEQGFYKSFNIDFNFIFKTKQLT